MIAQSPEIRNTVNTNDTNQQKKTVEALWGLAAGTVLIIGYWFCFKNLYVKVPSAEALITKNAEQLREKEDKYVAEMIAKKTEASIGVTKIQDKEIQKTKDAVSAQQQEFAAIQDKLEVKQTEHKTQETINKYTMKLQLDTNDTELNKKKTELHNEVSNYCAKEISACDSAIKESSMLTNNVSLLTDDEDVHTQQITKLKVNAQKWKAVKHLYKLSGGKFIKKK